MDQAVQTVQDKINDIKARADAEKQRIDQRAADEIRRLTQGTVDQIAQTGEEEAQKVEQQP